MKFWFMVVKLKNVIIFLFLVSMLLFVAYVCYFVFFSQVSGMYI